MIARYASHPAAGNVANDPVTLPAYVALAPTSAMPNIGEKKFEWVSREASEEQSGAVSMSAHLEADHETKEHIQSK